MTDEDLQQADLTHLRVTEMTPEQKAEMRRRYVEFVRRLAKPPVAAAPARVTKATKWVPGAKAR